MKASAIGVVEHLSIGSGNLILRAEREVKIGEVVLDNKKKKIGTVFDFFGPVSSPFISIRPTVENPEKYVGKPLYIKGGKR
jgi:RNA-binding protein